MNRYNVTAGGNRTNEFNCSTVATSNWALLIETL